MKQSTGFGTTGVIGIIAAVIVVGAIGVTLMNSKKVDEKQMMADKIQVEEDAMMEKEEMMKSEDGAMMDSEAEMKKDETMMDDDSMMKQDESAMMQKAGSYTAYSAESLAMAQKGRTVLFFHASWCSTCKSADADIVKNTAQIPAGLTILKTDYDKEIALKQKYGVTIQHTFVEIDSNGTLIQKWSGGNFAGIAAKL